MERSDVYVLKPAAPQRPWELYRNMLPDVPQQGQNAPGSQLATRPTAPAAYLVAHGYKLGPMQGGCRSNGWIERKICQIC